MTSFEVLLSNKITYLLTIKSLTIIKVSPEFVSLDISHFINSIVPKSREDNAVSFSNIWDFPVKPSLTILSNYRMCKKGIKDMYNILDIFLFNL